LKGEPIVFFSLPSYAATGGEPPLTQSGKLPISPSYVFVELDLVTIHLFFFSAKPSANSFFNAFTPGVAGPALVGFLFGGV